MTNPQALAFDFDAPFLRFSALANSVSGSLMAQNENPPARRGGGSAQKRRRKPDLYRLPADRPATPGELIKHHRTRLGLWQEDLAERLEVTAQTISRYERGRDLSTRKLEGIADALGLALGDLLPDAGGAPEDPDEAELIAIFRALDDRDREALLHMARTLGRPTLHDRDARAFTPEPPRPRRRS